MKVFLEKVLAAGRPLARSGRATASHLVRVRDRVRDRVRVRVRVRFRVGVRVCS